MNLKNSVMILEKVVSKDIFRKIRRKFALCQYNYHSAVMVKGKTGDAVDRPYEGICKHCGQHIYLDYHGHWRFAIQIWSGASPAPSAENEDETAGRTAQKN
ncbi:hypothetical protein [Novosphingobium sp. CECT 9465]|uniref:hypothetical protein n=1 Tax=Novosphingobium sp. CECT 9465 TaxID=2829794 RepID=UPI001E3E7C65|nr:hypothetical protein [Novosphingobium sp. CECT 9465]CAH0495844.1 hypothetical protein NVSP9465_00864 [Novosphingobium sp. CECT 9465]